jgi:hypothetical protein
VCLTICDKATKKEKAYKKMRTGYKVVCLHKSKEFARSPFYSTYRYHPGEWHEPTRRKRHVIQRTKSGRLILRLRKYDWYTDTPRKTVKEVYGGALHISKTKKAAEVYDWVWPGDDCRVVTIEVKYLPEDVIGADALGNIAVKKLYWPGQYL